MVISCKYTKYRTIRPSVSFWSSAFHKNRKSECREVCFALPNCTHASVESKADNDLECLVSFAVAEYHLLKSVDTAITFVKQPLYPVKGREMYYNLVRSGGKWFDANRTCYDEGGQLAILSTNQTMDEAIALLQSAGISEAWIGLFSAWSAGRGMEGPKWQLRTGAIPALTRPTTDYVRCYTLSKDPSGVWNIINIGSNACATPLPYVCQRSY
ncbi:uncharacterized protein LOC135211420 [Macrobrachium nipponense]|uniref:uncharacterized protein LOC135211420 n=1 Tax=Macrobrachium nipponense TaxID=159736 RepID=UPI0030C85221